MMMNIRALPKDTFRLLNKLKKHKFLQSFYLSGGTALSLHLGHRESEDLDFFSQKNFNPLLLQRKIEKIGRVQNVALAEGTLNLFLEGVKLQFLHYPYPLLEPPINWNNIKVSALADIACTKLQTIAMRGSKKDFLDFFFLLKKYSLTTLFEKMKKKYKGVDYNQPFILKSLVYFADAENQPLPKMHTEISWKEVKEEIIKAAKNFKL